MLEKIKNSLFSFLQIKHFVFRFQIYEKQTDIVNDTQVIQYEFVNLGDSEVQINSLPLQPLASNFHRIKLDIRAHERDITIYRVKFSNASGLCTATFTSTLCACALKTDTDERILTDTDEQICTDQ